MGARFLNWEQVGCDGRLVSPLQIPELIRLKERRICRRLVFFVMINIGFIISFLILLLLVIYEEDLNSLVTV